MEKFLEFWSHHNATIIESLVALILVSVIYLAYRMFFGPKGPDAFDTAGAGGATIDTTHIEKTLQKILEQQSSTKASSSSDDSKSAKGSAASAELVQEVASLKRTVEEKEKHIVQLKSQVEVAEKLAAASAAAAAESGAAPAPAAVATPAASNGLDEKERQNYEAKIKELEAKLAEYEIISEDIADVSFFKEENARLNSELAALKAGGATPAAAPAAAATPAQAAAAPASTEMSQEAIDAALLKELASQSPAAAASDTAAPSAPEASAEAMNAIDDSLMAEFARAVEGQKEGTLEEPKDTAAKSDEEAKLLEEFENFSKKG